ncbi:DMT family transporter [Kaistia geumhonensis]|uniref:Drug/metabolite transporter (DMT)-like permease n=1 Tax=Kaistia geumhonensis TaxID=410839 RepID=A0ABU0M6P8_9HYPH|nr:DMT family transporter [Kaistia geumhonensis]MCX5478145.1 DMT family transporter [Kaistia geumhonensis]MDQ0516639.1 drug/metabolite transporter (DMT)-like permease [Kaistia geumhonensis]
MTTGGKGAATAVGAVAILLWSCLALVTSLSRAIPTFEALAITFAIGAVTLSLCFLPRQGFGGIARSFRLWPARAWALAIIGIFAYHALYFVAFRLAPVGPVTVINYLWPLAIVLFAGLLPGGDSRLGWPQLAGGLIGFAATVLLVGTGSLTETAGAPAPLLGYAAALACAVLWGLYSVLNNRIAAPGSEPMIGVCAAIAVLGALGHVATGETFVMPDGRAALALLALGIGPVGAAFAAWDHATKKGNIALLGALSYATPPLSMILLVVAGEAEPSWRLLVATLLVVAGAALAAMPARRR